MRRALAACALLLGASGLGACSSKEKPGPPVVRPALTMLVELRPADHTAFVGSAEPRWVQELAFRVGGRVIRRSASVGDHVKLGAEIGALDPQALLFAMRAAEANITSLNARLSDSSRLHVRNAALFEQQGIARSSADDALSARDVAAAQLGEGQARLAKAREDLGYSVLRSELDGFVTRISFEVGQTVDDQRVVAEVARTDALDLIVDLPESAARTVHVGDRFTISPADAPGAKLGGTARQVNPEADELTRTRRIWIAIEDPQKYGVRPGTTLAATAADEPRVLRIPASAILDKFGKTSVWVVDEGLARERPVELGGRTQTEATVLQGIKDGDRLIIAGVHGLTENQRVRVEGEVRP